MEVLHSQLLPGEQNQLKIRIVPILKKIKPPQRIVSGQSINIRFCFYFFLLFGLLFSACKKEDKIQLNWEELNSGTNSELTGVYFTDDNTGHVVGGHTFFSGIYLQTKDGGDTWQSDPFSGKQLFGLSFNSNNIGHSVGIDGFLFSITEPYENWNFYRLPNWDLLRDVAFNSKNEGILVGGVAFANGQITIVDTNYQAVKVDTFEHQFDAVSYSDDETIHVAGYGIILRSSDKGQTWVDSGISGDFYRSISFPSATTGYIVGYSGSILKTTDNGLNWKYLRDGDELSVTDKPFRSVYFMDNLKGFIVGENGLCWRTQDGGDSWETVTGLPDFDFIDVFANEDNVFIVGEGGRILRLEQ